jgi:hypothetical protein
MKYLHILGFVIIDPCYLNPFISNLTCNYSLESQKPSARWAEFAKPWGQRLFSIHTEFRDPLVKTCEISAVAGFYEYSFKTFNLNTI